jgi:CubicO group peptidase (beta-lactamase class C family)
MSTRYAPTTALLAAFLWATLAPFGIVHAEPKAPPANTLQPGDPAEVGMDAAALARIPVRMQAFVDQKQIAGAVTLVARAGRVVHLEAVGHADCETARPAEKDTMFAIASMTKPVTATAVMILQDEGKLSVDDPVSKYVPQFKNVTLDGKPPQREITLRDLLTHTSGIGGGQQNQGSLKRTVELIAAEPMQFKPGSQWKYSPGVTVCGRVIEVASGQPYDEFLAQRIFRPLKMVDTTFYPDAGQQKRLATLYKPTPDKQSIEPARHWLSELSPERTPNPSGGLFSTASDLARFYQMILGGGQLDGQRIVSPEAVRQMLTVETGDLTTGFTPGNGWGLGWCIVRQPQEVTQMLSPGTFGHGGAFGTQGWVDPARQMIFVLMIQRTGFGNSDGADIRGEFQRLAVEAIRD